MRRNYSLKTVLQTGAHIRGGYGGGGVTQLRIVRKMIGHSLDFLSLVTNHISINISQEHCIEKEMDLPREIYASTYTGHASDPKTGRLILARCTLTKCVTLLPCYTNSDDKAFITSKGPVYTVNR